MNKQQTDKKTADGKPFGLGTINTPAENRSIILTIGWCGHETKTGFVSDISETNQLKTKNAPNIEAF